jgi:protein-S-isoprenylcysteine O-methyltransferase Ste14
LWTGTSPAGLPEWLVLAGWALAVAGAVLFAAAASVLGRFLTPFPEPLPRAQLRTGGVYALVRHPIYTAVLGMALGWALVQRSLWGVLFDVLLLVFFDRKVVAEERRLLAKFPDYAAYRQRVRKLIPGIY